MNIAVQFISVKADGKHFISSFSWNTATVVLQIAIQLGYTALLARLIAPSNFAIMGVVLSIMGFAEIFSQIGLGPALIQRKEVTQAHLNSAFTTSLALGVSFTLLFVFASPFLAKAYNIPSLATIIPVVCTSFTISALSVVPRNMMMKEMRFKSFFTASMISIVGGNLVVGLWLAYTGYEIWAYVWALFAQNALMTVAFWILQPVKVQFKWAKQATLELLNYGAGSSLFNALNYAATKVDVTVLPLFSKGTFLFPNTISLTDAGKYERGAYVASLPITIMAKLSDSVLFSGMAKLQDEQARLKRIVLASTNTLSILIFGTSCFVIVFSEELLRIYLGDVYAGAAPLMQWLFVAVIFRTLTRPNDALLRAKGQVFRGSYVKGIYLVIMIVGVMITARNSPTAVAASIAVTTAIHYIMMVTFAQRISGITVGEQLKSLIPGTRIGFVVLLLGVLSKYIAFRLHFSGQWMLLLGSVLIVFGGAVLVYFKPRWLGDREVNPLFVVPERFRKLPFLRKIYVAFENE